MTNSIKEKEEMTTFIEKILVSVFMLIIGVLFCCKISAAVRITVGVILCIYGVVNLIIIGIARRPLIGIMGVLNGAIIATGIAFCSHDLATVVVLLIPFLLTIIGALTFIDGFICFFSYKQGTISRLIVFSIVGSGMLSLGMSFHFNHEFRIDYSQLVFGIMLCLGSVALLGYTIYKRVKKRADDVDTDTVIF